MSATDRPSDPQDLDRAIATLSQLQSDLHQQQARDLLQALAARLEDSPRERAGLAAQLESLASWTERLERSVLQIAAFGLVGRGKSSVLNALLGEEVFATGPLHGVTQTSSSALCGLWQRDRRRFDDLPDDGDGPGYAAAKDERGQVELIDTPGLDEVGGEAREALAKQVAAQADLLLFVVSGDMSQIEHQALRALRATGKPMVLVFNKIDRYPQADREAIYAKIRDERVRELLSPAEIVLVAAAPLVRQGIRRPNGSLGVEMTRGPAQIEPLRLKILEILAREGKALTAINSLLFAKDLSDRLLARQRQIRAEHADSLLWQATSIKAIAVAINPVVVLDLLGGAAIDLSAIVALARIYGVSLSQTAALGLLRQIALGLGGVGATELLAVFGLGSLKSALGLGAPLTGGATLAPLASVALAQGAIAGLSTYAIGKIANRYLLQGASWGPTGIKATISQILADLDEASILQRLKNEIAARLDVEVTGPAE
ncbi:MAG: GTP-binding protein [Cyanobacteria bacterium J06641_5]